MIEMIKFPGTIDIDYGEEINPEWIFTELFSREPKHESRFEGKKIREERIPVSGKALRKIIYGSLFAGRPNYELQELKIENTDILSGLANEKHFLRFSLGTFNEEKDIKKVRDDVFRAGGFCMRYIDHDVEFSGYIRVEQYQWRLIDRLFGKHVKW